MKDMVQIKAELFEGQHDALIAFYETYPRLFVNKLLLRLCEAFMPTYKPNLALFHPHPEVGRANGRKIAIRLEKDKCPLFWQFYKDLPYGSRVLVIVNLMNHYVQLVEGNRALLEQVYWKGAIDDLPVDGEGSVRSIPQVAGEALQDQGSVHGSKEAVKVDALTPHDEGIGEVGGGAPPEVMAEVLVDPLASHEVGL